MIEPVFENMSQFMWLCIKIKKEVVDFSTLDSIKDGN